MKVIPQGSVDFIFDTTGEAMRFLSLMTPSTSFIASIATTPSGNTLQKSSILRRPNNPQVPWFARMLLNATDAIRRARASRWHVEYEYLFLQPNGVDLDVVTKAVEERKLVPVVGSRVSLHDIDKVREACGVVYKGKGGIGKTVIEVVAS